MSNGLYRILYGEEGEKFFSLYLKLLNFFFLNRFILYLIGSWLKSCVIGLENFIFFM